MSTLSQIRERLSSLSSSTSTSSSPDGSFLSRKIGSGLATPATTVEGFFTWKIMLVVVLLIAMIWVIQPYVGHFLNVVSLLKSFMEGTETSSDQQKEKEKTKTNDKVSQSVNGKKKKSLEEPAPDDSASSVQGGAKSGFCLAGEWKGVRSCVKVKSAKDCVSGQLFPNETTCVNPTLRS